MRQNQASASFSCLHGPFGLQGDERGEAAKERIVPKPSQIVATEIPVRREKSIER